jgi:putative tryptophan/tyrosine transport system ATP-binding protein
MLTLTNLHVTFNPGTPLMKAALLGLDLTIPTGQFITVIGSNGAGKSTLLNVISGDIRPQQGQVSINDQDITPWPAAKRALMISRVFQNPLLGTCPELTLEENLVLALRRGKPKRLKPALNKSLRDRFRDRLASLGLGLETRLCDRIGLLSGGQRQAVSLVMATLAPTQILLLDEHTAALDPKTAQAILQLTQTLVSENQLTTLMVTHSMQQALTLGDRLLMLHEGRILFDISGNERTHLQVNDLIARFSSHQFSSHQEEITNDTLLLE